MASLIKSDPGSASSQIGSIVDQYISDTQGILSSIDTYISANSYSGADADSVKNMLSNLKTNFTNSIGIAESLKSSAVSANGIMDSYIGRDPKNIDDPLDDSKIGEYKEKVQQLKNKVSWLEAQKYNPGYKDKKGVWHEPSINMEICNMIDSLNLEIKGWEEYIMYLEDLQPTDVVAAGSLQETCGLIDAASTSIM